MEKVLQAAGKVIPNLSGMKFNFPTYVYEFHVAYGRGR